MSILSGIADDVLQTRLEAAQTAYLDLCAGAAVVSVRAADGKSVTFSPATVGDLRRHIMELQAALGIAPSRQYGYYLTGNKGP